MNNIETFLKDLSYGSTFRFLDEGKDKDKLIEIAKKRGIVLPAHDLAIFECIYAFIDKENKNKCTLPKEEVEASLKTLIGKSIDLDHFRKNVVGYWIDAKLQDDKIIAYGMIFKGSFKEDYNVIKELFDKGNLTVSFEAWGDRVYKGDESYSLTDIEFAGGALLLREKPAFAGAGVLEMAKDRVLEFAKVMTEPEEFVHKRIEKNNGDLEESRYYLYDVQSIFQALSEVECLTCKERNMMDVLNMDYENNFGKIKCVSCGAEMSVNFTPTSKLTKKGRKVKKMTDWVVKANFENVGEYIKTFEGPDTRLNLVLEQSFLPYPHIDAQERENLSDEEFAIVKIIEESKRKLKVFPIHDTNHIAFVRSLLNHAAVDEFLKQLNIGKDSVERKISRRVITIAMKELIEKFKKGTIQEVVQEIAKATINRELTKEELEQANTSLNEIVKQAVTANTTSLQNTTGTSTSNATSVQTASITEEIVKEVIAKVTTPVPIPDNTASEDVQKKLDETTKALTESSKKLEEMAKVLEEAQKKIADFEKAQKETEEKAKQEKIKVRKDELADFAKDMTDEDILDDAKFELKKKDKEIAELKTKGSTNNVDLTKGATDKDKPTGEALSRQRVNQFAYDNRHQGEQK
jgi:hypothetical protein